MARLTHVTARPLFKILFPSRESYLPWHGMANARITAKRTSCRRRRRTSLFGRITTRACNNAVMRTKIELTPVENYARKREDKKKRA